MSRIINGVLYVESFNATENPGEYTFESALFNNQADTLNNGAFDIKVGFALFVQASDRNTFAPIPGAVNRYKIINISYIDNVRISGTILWDSTEEEIDAPTNGSFCNVAQVTNNLGLGIPAIDNIYPDLPSGNTLSALLNDLINIMDKLSNRPPDIQRVKTQRLLVTDNNQRIFPLIHTPVDIDNTELTVNGLTYVYGEANDFTVVNNRLMWSEQSFALISSDVVVIKYTY